MQGFADAAGKYQLLVDGGVTNSRLYFNLGNAYLEGGDVGKAIANYLRSLHIEPTLRAAQSNLARARALVQSQSEAEPAAESASASIAQFAAIGNAWLNSRFSPYAVFVVMVVAWAAIWISVALRLCGARFPWKTIAAVASVTFALAAVSTFISSRAGEQQLAVVVTTPSTSGASAEPSANVKAGEVVEIVQKRGDSTRIRTDGGATQWLPSETIEAI
jgi:hypothetical protein